MYCKCFLLALMIWLGQCKITYGQCSVTSTDGYTVEIRVTPQSIVAPASCPFGYNYNVQMSYEINFTGPAPASVYTLQGHLTCNQGDLFFNLPNSPGSGTFVTTVNPYNTDTDCATATVTSLGCQDVNIDINGPGIPAQTINCTNSGLPIELLRFKAYEKNNEEVQLDWITLSEIDNDYFTIERSSNGLKWNEIQRIKGAGNSKEILHYRYVDQYPLSGISYYRLKQTDLDGSFTYSKIESVNIIQPKTTLKISYSSIYPNQVTIEGDSQNLRFVQVYNKLGQVFTSRVPVSSIHASKLTLDLTQIPSGIYFIRTQTASARVYRK
ncbi:hypothetical protein BKI52_40155 [marine bacterium AO1-C]|nr:hypothetical protein BKI52_40155 [marine bacterium AO1-C]